MKLPIILSAVTIVAVACASGSAQTATTDAVFDERPVSLSADAAELPDGDRSGVIVELLTPTLPPLRTAASTTAVVEDSAASPVNMHPDDEIMLHADVLPNAPGNPASAESVASFVVNIWLNQPPDIAKLTLDTWAADGIIVASTYQAMERPADNPWVVVGASRANSGIDSTVAVAVEKVDDQTRDLRTFVFDVLTSAVGDTHLVTSIEMSRR